MEGDSRAHGCKVSLKWKSLHAELKEYTLHVHSIDDVKGRCHHIHDDPYLGGQQSGKWAKLNVVSPEANTNAHAKVSQSMSISAMPNITPIL
jgi:hypothetical protein